MQASRLGRCSWFVDRVKTQPRLAQAQAFDRYTTIDKLITPAEVDMDTQIDLF